MCISCADALLAGFSLEDLIAYDRLGRDVLRDRKLGVVRPKGYLADKLKEYKKGNSNERTTTEL